MFASLWNPILTIPFFQMGCFTTNKDTIDTTLSNLPVGRQRLDVWKVTDRFWKSMVGFNEIPDVHLWEDPIFRGLYKCYFRECIHVFFYVALFPPMPFKLPWEPTTVSLLTAISPIFRAQNFYLSWVSNMSSFAWFFVTFQEMIPFQTVLTRLKPPSLADWWRFANQAWSLQRGTWYGHHNFLCVHFFNLRKFFLYGKICRLDAFKLDVFCICLAIGRMGLSLSGANKKKTLPVVSLVEVFCNASPHPLMVSARAARARKAPHRPWGSSRRMKDVWPGGELGW